MKQKHPRVFYGWWIVGAAFFIALYTAGAVSYGFTTIFEPIVEEFSWSYMQVSLAASIRGLETGLLAPVAGLLVDRLGPRRLLFAGVTLVGMGMMLVSQTTSLAMFYGAMALVAIGVSGCSSTIVMAAVANWFRKRIGLAIAIVASGHGFSGLLVPVMVTLVDRYEWRTAVVVIGAGMLVLGIPLSLLVRHRPEQYGYQPYGEPVRPTGPGDGPAVVDVSEGDIGAGEALRSSTFRHIAIGLGLQFIILGAVITHIMPYLSSVGISRTMSGLVASAVPLISIIGRFGFGWLVDKVEKRRLAAGGLAMVVLSMLLFSFASAAWMWLLVPFAVLFGIGYGGLVVMRVAMVRNYFGRAHFGAIHGSVVGILALGQVIGAFLPGWVYDTWGSYQGTWLVFSGLAAVAMITVATTPPVETADRPTK